MLGKKTTIYGGYSKGFTVVELGVVIVILSVIFIISVLAGSEYAVAARDSERAADTSVITSGLERYYRSQSTELGATYPSSTTAIATITSFIQNQDVLMAPGESTISLTVAANANPQTPTPQQYIYQPLRLNGTLCTAVPCERYKLYYYHEESRQVITLHSLRQQ